MTGPALRPAVFLDRDGVINRATVRGTTPYPPQTLADVEILPGVPEALEKIRRLGVPIIVVTNQPDVARGTQTREVVESINDSLRQRLPITAVYTCYHDNKDQCGCRKPAPGMLTRAAADFGIDLAASYIVGDRWSDIAAGAAVNCQTFLIDLPYSQGSRCTPDHTVADLPEAVDLILRRLERDGEQQETV